MPASGRDAGLGAAGRLEAVIAAIDAANSQDPRRVEVRGVQGPKELLHSELMTEWVLRMDPEAGDAQLVAARAHHLRRWEHPRGDYPEGRAGYRRWRAAAKQSHADMVGDILRSNRAPEPFIEDVGRIVRKDGLGHDPAVQLHEDALCLVFLETELDDLISRLGAEKAGDVLRRTIGKMSAAGISATAAVAVSPLGRSSLQAALDVRDGVTSQ